MRKWLFAVVGLVAGFSVADAQPNSRTAYTYYTVSGDSAGELYDSMIRRGPHVNGAKAYASTAASSSQQGKLLQGKSCRIIDYRLSLKFVIRLPKFANEGALSGETRSRWRAFSAFLRKHEETHRSIWLDCAHSIEAQVTAIRASNCKSAEAQSVSLWNSIRASCLKRHDAFDAAEQRRLIKHPFVRLVLSKAAEPARGAVARKKKRRV